MWRFVLVNYMIPVCMPNWCVKANFIWLPGPDYLSRKGTPQQPSELLEHEVIGFTRPSYINTWPIKVNGEYFLAQPKIKASSGETVRQLCLRGQGIARLSEFETGRPRMRDICWHCLKTRLNILIKASMQCLISKHICRNGFAYLLSLTEQLVMDFRFANSLLGNL